MKKKDLNKKRKENRINDQNSRFGANFYDYEVLSDKGFDRFNPKDAKYTITLVPFLIGKNPFKGETTGSPAYAVYPYVHYGQGVNGKDSVVCLMDTYGEPCPICDHINKSDLTEEERKPLKAKKRMFCLVLEKGEKKVKFFAVSAPLFDIPLDRAVTAFTQKAEEAPAPYYIEGGSYFTFFDQISQKKGLDRFHSFIIHSEESKLFGKINKKITEQVFSLDELVYKPTHAEVQKAMYFDMDELDDSETDENEEPLEAYVEHLPKEKKKKKKKKDKKKKDKDKD